MNFILASLIYVISDQYFWVSMALTTGIGLFVGAVIYDGVLKEVNKAVVVMLSYAFLILMTNVERIYPIIVSSNNTSIHQPFAGSATIFLVTIFYLLGMWLGVMVANKAHKGNKL